MEIIYFTHAGHLTAIQTTPPYRRHTASPESVVGALIQIWMNKWTIIILLWLMMIII